MTAALPPQVSTHSESDRWIPVSFGDQCIGFLMRKRNRFEAISIDSKSLGLFDDEAAAVGALFRSKHKGAADDVQMRQVRSKF
jgi:hypothetical protein